MTPVSLLLILRLRDTIRRLNGCASLALFHYKLYLLFVSNILSIKY